MEAAMTGTLLGDYLSEEKFAAELGVSIRTLRNWRQQRYGPPFVTIGKKIVYGKSSGLAWLQSQERQPLRKRAIRA
jgi:DNA-binding transcriptional MerR regulator